MKLKPLSFNLTIAIVLSLVLHGILLTIQFAPPRNFTVNPSRANLEIILVNGKNEPPTLNPEFLAQSNLNGGGRHEIGRVSSPFPDLQQVENNDNVEALRQKIEVLNQQQKLILANLNKTVQLPPPPTLNPHQNSNQISTEEGSPTHSQLLEQRLAEISQQIKEQSKRPLKKFDAPSAISVEYAQYYKNFQSRIEEVGTLNFPQHNGRKLYGSLIILIPIFQDGSLYLQEDGVRIEKSSGNPLLDKAALRIVHMAAPFGPFPEKMRSTDHNAVWVVVTQFDFTHEGDVKISTNNS